MNAKSAVYDLKITDGFIVDGSATSGYAGDIGIRDGQLVAVGEAAGGARETIDAHGHVVAPGFIDIHTHYDAQVLWDRILTISPWHGVTSVVISNCGFSIAPTRPEHREIIIRTLENVEGMTVAALHAGLESEWPFETFPQYLDVLEARGDQSLGRGPLYRPCISGHRRVGALNRVRPRLARRTHRRSQPCA